MIVNPATAPTESRPLGRCRLNVRGFPASRWRSTSRLNAIAAERAVAMQSRMPSQSLGLAIQA